MSTSSVFSALANSYLKQVEPYVPGLTSREAAERYGVPVEEIVKLSSNENPLGPPPMALQAAEAALRELHRYPDSRAIALRRAIAAREGLTPENVIIGAGSSEIMSFIIRAFSGPGDEVVSMDPSFTVYAELATADGRRPVFMPLNFPFELHLEEVLAARSDRTRVIFLTRPNNPTSRLIPLDVFQAIAERLPNAVVVADEAYIEFADDYRQQTAAHLISTAGNVLVTRTFSKAYGIPNLRVGYTLGPADAIDYLFKIKPKWNVGDVAQQAAVGALQDHDHFEKTLAVVEVGRQYLCDHLTQVSGLQVVPEPQGNFVMVRVHDTGLSAEAFTDAIGTYGFTIRGDFHPDYVRISIGTEPQNIALVQAIRQMIASRMQAASDRA